MTTYNIFTNQKDTLPEGKADFLLAASVTKISEIDEDTLTPTLDAEFISTQRVFSHSELSQTPMGIPSPVVISRAVHNLKPFSSIEILDLGLTKKPEQTQLHNFNMNPTNCITSEANIDAKEIFAKGMDFGKNYELKGAYLILAISMTNATRTALASCLALGYDCKQGDASNLSTLSSNSEMNKFEKLSVVSDNTLLFCAGFLLEASRRFHVVLAGDIEMAASLLIADALREDVLMRPKSQNITFATTSWALKTTGKNITHLLSQLSYTPHAIYTDFSFENTEIPILKEYDKGAVKETSGAGAALAYASANKLTQQEVLDAIELIIYMM